MGEEYEIVDRYGRRTGQRARRVGGGDGCFSPLLLIPVAIIVGIWLLLQASCNYLHYHNFTYDTSSAQRGATATVAAPFNYDEKAVSAETKGKAAVTTENNSQGVKLDVGGSVTFHVNIGEAGLYYLCMDGSDSDQTRPASTPGTRSNMIVDVVVNGKLHDQINDDDGNRIISSKSLGSQSPNSCVNDSPLQLNSGANAVQIKLDEKTQCAYYACPALFVKSITLDKKFGVEQTTVTQQPAQATPTPVHLASKYQGLEDNDASTPPYDEYKVTLEITKTNADGSFEGKYFATAQISGLSIGDVFVRGLCIPFDRIGSYSQIDAGKVARLKQKFGSSGSLFQFTTTRYDVDDQIELGVQYYGVLSKGSVQGIWLDGTYAGTFKLSPA